MEPPQPGRTDLDSGTGRASLGDRLGLKLAGIRTGTSSEGGRATEPVRISAETAGKAAAALLGIALALAGWSVRVRSRNTKRLRQPTDQQRTDMTTPAGDILLRHIPKGWTGDLIDGLALIGAAGVYANDGPLMIPAPHAVDASPEEE